MFMLCEAMKWSHLPNAGGIYDQTPELIDGFLMIFAARSKHEAEEQAKKDRGMGKTSRVAGRRRR